ncbi:alpha/beta hydrolase [Massilia sp. PAMC28688]|uniref:alpha/beta fold hydrolase n=1 Tax=Massilia sp. PAMC28688 TaxID=2861283 RepID=UPI001C632617|nr:alpha/beta hydrolase [Massilia sp. PAMC28688]QYF94171.1 alpha/beta hydrolase [Massilia sp. PAMC28688]
MRSSAPLWFASLLALSPLVSAQGGSAPAAAPVIASAPLACKAGQAISEEGFVKLGGIEQWVTIKGSDCRNPVILFIHGGPGNPNTPYANLPYNAWEKDFTLVQWDQRGAGRTFTRNPATADAKLTVEQMAKDGTELAAFLQTRLGKKKVILFGGSWGSLLSVHMAKMRPELFGAYLGTGQMVKTPDNQRDGYNKLLGLARAAGDGPTVTALEALGDPPWVSPRSFGIMRRASRKYEAMSAEPTPKAWFAPAPAYASEQAQAEYERGEEYSFLQFVGMKGDGMLSTVDLPKLGYDFRMPVFLVQGEHDLITTPAMAKGYFDGIKAPHKEFFLLPRVGHDPNPAMVAAQYDILKNKIAPLMK